MSTATGLQALFARMLVDPSLMLELDIDPEGFAARNGADVAEVRQLSLVGRERIRAVAGPMIMGKVVWTISRTFPATAILLHEVALSDDRVVPAVIQTRLQSIRETRPIDLRLETLVDILAAWDISPVLRSVIRFEVIWYRLRHSGGTRWSMSENACFAERPLLRPDIAVEAFDLPVAKAYRGILARAPLDDLGKGITHYVMRADPGSRVRVTRVSERVSRILRACDGITSTAQIAARLGLSVDEVSRVLRQASHKGLVSVAAAPTASSRRRPPV